MTATGDVKATDMSQWLRDRLRDRPDPEPDEPDDPGDMSARIRRAAGHRPKPTTTDAPDAA